MPLLGSMRGSLNFGQINELANYSNATMVFVQTNAPLNWTKSTSFDDYTLRIAGAGQTVSTGGEVNFSESVFASNTSLFISANLQGSPGGATGATAISLTTLPAHTHQRVYNDGRMGYPPGSGEGPSATSRPIGIFGNTVSEAQVTPSNLNPPTPLGGGSHSHPIGDLSFSGNLEFNMNFKLKYVDCIIATFNY